ncbi:Gfo/Idh/MocA family protein [Rariglobus hedericola]|uniref:Gfo/Idh/MocA family oxidoreductase n=1 Tax=Rariglobus hedericola TaxID=2597822 RepID=A0A556QQT7_9BACT|nr:Gfo/Idh/MocA family oxidoreductase [Rariglobus hedericola]TSJ78992.1 Gfo/Idh/MocA family oxidoreductase [Rariglobus hedericola]
MDSSSSPLTFAIVGCGSISPTHAKALRALPPADARLTHCCDINTTLAEAFAKQFDLKIASFEELLADPAIDVLTFCTPSGLHASLGARALAAGKHVVIEKPMEITAAACEPLIAAQRAAGCKLAIISQHRFDPSSQQVRGAIDRGELGSLVLAEARVPWHRSQEYYDSGDWRGTWALDGGGCLMNQGVHTVDLLLWLAGPVKTVYAQMRTAAHERIEVEDVVTATLTFANGAIGNLMATTSAYPGFPAYLGLHGTQGSAVIEGDELHLLAIKGRDTIHGKTATAHALQVATGGTKSATANASAIPATAPADGAWAWGDAHREQFADFIRAVRTDGTPLVDGVAGRAAVALINAVYESARTGRVIILAD